MAKWPWIERPFNFDYPAAKFPDLLERVRGTPVRLEERTAGLAHDVLTRRDGEGWSIQENVGHLLDVDYLPMKRLRQILSGEPVLHAADMSCRRTHEADHNAAAIADLLAGFREKRGQLVAALEQVDEADWGKAALHPRLKQQMRIVDIAHFHGEHDDYHLARIGALVAAFG